MFTQISAAVVPPPLTVPLAPLVPDDVPSPLDPLEPSPLDPLEPSPLEPVEPFDELALDARPSVAGSSPHEKHTTAHVSAKARNAPILRW